MTKKNTDATSLPPEEFPSGRRHPHFSDQTGEGGHSQSSREEPDLPLRDGGHSQTSLTTDKGTFAEGGHSQASRRLGKRFGRYGRYNDFLED